MTSDIERLIAENLALRQALAENVVGFDNDVAGTILLALDERWTRLNKAREEAGYEDDEKLIIQLQRIEAAATVVAGR